MESIAFKEPECARRGKTPHDPRFETDCVFQASFDLHCSDSDPAVTVIHRQIVDAPGIGFVAIRHRLRVDRTDRDLDIVVVGSNVECSGMIVTRCCR